MGYTRPTRNLPQGFSQQPWPSDSHGETEGEKEEGSKDSSGGPGGPNSYDPKSGSPGGPDSTGPKPGGPGGPDFCGSKFSGPGGPDSGGPGGPNSGGPKSGGPGGPNDFDPKSGGPKSGCHGGPENLLQSPLNPPLLPLSRRLSFSFISWLFCVHGPLQSPLQSLLQSGSPQSPLMNPLQSAGRPSTQLTKEV